MNIICTPAGIIDSIRPAQGVMDITAAGFKDILLDLSMFCSPGELENLGKKQNQQNNLNKPDNPNGPDSQDNQNNPNSPDNSDNLNNQATGNKPKETTRPLVSQHPSQLKNNMERLLSHYRNAGITTTIARAPYLQRNTKRQDLNTLLLDLAREGLKVCGVAGCRYMIVRPLFSGINCGEEWDINREYYLKLADTAREHNMMILLENQCRDVNGHLVRGICSDAFEAARWVDSLNAQAGGERFGFCMDAGACSLCGQNMQEFITAMGSRIKAVVLRDCDGTKESSMLPFTCSGFGQTNTDWLGLIRGLRSISFDGQLILDFATTAGFFSPILRPQLLQLAKAVGEYFKWQINMENLLKKYKSVVLFGAGNMCRNYMKCYGQDYPPLYTCDNNSKLWGTRFSGLEVKSPESLKQLPEDCVIFICNIYYREIEKQLRDMGIQNDIEFFSDEYMPSFYFDRLERSE